MNRWTPKTAMIAAGVAVVGVWFVSRKATDAAQAVNPLNHDNVFNRGAQSVWDVFTDGRGSIGTDVADWNQELNEKYYRYTPLGVWDSVTEWWEE